MWMDCNSRTSNLSRKKSAFWYLCMTLGWIHGICENVHLKSMILRAHPNNLPPIFLLIIVSILCLIVLSIVLRI